MVIWYGVGVEEVGQFNYNHALLLIFIQTASQFPKVIFYMKRPEKKINIKSRLGAICDMT